MKKKIPSKISEDSQFPLEIQLGVGVYMTVSRFVLTSQPTWIVTYFYWFSVGSESIITSLHVTLNHNNCLFPLGEREALLGKLAKMLSSASPQTAVHFEMASFVDESLMSDLLEFVLPHADRWAWTSKSCPNILSLFRGSNLTVLSDPNPRVATVLDQMRELLPPGKPAPPGGRDGSAAHTPSRPHAGFQAIIVKQQPPSGKNTMSATAKASLTAHRHVCGSPDIDLSKARLIMDESFSISRQEGSQRIPLQESRPVSCWDEAATRFAWLLCWLCTEVVPDSAGGGDNISAAGLVLQIWIWDVFCLFFFYCIIIFFGEETHQNRSLWSFELGESHKTCQQHIHILFHP